MIDVNTDWDEIADDYFALTAQLRSPHTVNRLRAAEALQRLADPRAVLPLIQALSNADVELRTAIMQAFGQLGVRAVPQLCELLQERKWPPEFRADVAAVLGVLGRPEVFPVLQAALIDPEPSVRSSICAALERLGLPETVPVLIGCLSDTAEPVRQRAARALGHLGDSRAIPALIDALQRGNDWDRPAIAQALGLLATQHPLPELQSALPILRRLSGRHPGDPKTLPYQELMTQIQTTTDTIKRLPLPSMSAQSSLPFPAAAPTAVTDTLPLPATVPQGQPTAKRRSWRFWERG